MKNILGKILHSNKDDIIEISNDEINENESHDTEWALKHSKEILYYHLTNKCSKYETQKHFCLTTYGFHMAMEKEGREDLCYVAYSHKKNNIDNRIRKVRRFHYTPGIDEEIKKYKFEPWFKVQEEIERLFGFKLTRDQICGRYKKIKNNSLIENNYENNESGKKIVTNDVNKINSDELIESLLNKFIKMKEEMKKLEVNNVELSELLKSADNEISDLKKEINLLRMELKNRPTRNDILVQLQQIAGKPD